MTVVVNWQAALGGAGAARRDSRTAPFEGTVPFDAGAARGGSADADMMFGCTDRSAAPSRLWSSSSP